MTEAGTSYSLRTATPDDVGFLADVVISATLDQSRFPADFDERSFRARYEPWLLEQIETDPTSVTSVVLVDGHEAGRLRVVRTPERVELAGVQLLTRYQARGVGSQIVRALQEEAAAAGVPLELGVEKDNPRAHRLYERLGFVQVGEDAHEHLLRWVPETEEDR